MESRRWLILTLVLTIGLAVVIVGANMAVDIYGLFRPVEGRRLIVYGDPRIAKYLLSSRYVPANFNAILIGSSVSGNWDTTAIRKLRVYNASLNGGNIVEGKAIIDAALAAPGISCVFLIVHPSMTSSSSFPTADMTPALKKSAFGSVSLIEAYKDMVKARMRRTPSTFDYAGTEHFHLAPDLNPTMKAMWAPGTPFPIDGTALNTYREVIRSIRSHNARLVFIVPPAWDGLLAVKQPFFDNYAALIRQEAQDGDRWIDFTTPRYAALRSSRGAYADGVHMTSETARRVVAEMNR